jgi:hypothetical protein
LLRGQERGRRKENQGEQGGADGIGAHGLGGAGWEEWAVDFGFEANVENGAKMPAGQGLIMGTSCRRMMKKVRFSGASGQVGSFG